MNLHRIEDHRCDEPWIVASRNETREKIEIAVSRLSFRRRHVLKLTTGLLDGFAYTPREIARLLKTNVMSIRRLEDSAKSSLKRMFAMQSIDDCSVDFKPSMPTKKED